MLDRVLAAIVALTLGALLVQCLCALAMSALHWLSATVSSLGAAFLAILFLVGAVAKLLEGLRGHDRRSVREHRSEQRAVRQSVRRPAADVPIEAEHSAPDDDPALDDTDEEDES